MRRVSGYALDGALVLVTYRRLERDARRPETGVVQAASMAGAPVSVGSCRFAADPLLQRHQDWDDLRVSVSLPDNDVNVIAVGGTYVWMAEDGTYIH